PTRRTPGFWTGCSATNKGETHAGGGVQAPAQGRQDVRELPGGLVSSGGVQRPLRRPRSTRQRATTRRRARDPLGRLPGYPPGRGRLRARARGRERGAAARADRRRDRIDRAARALRGGVRRGVHVGRSPGGLCIRAVGSTEGTAW